ncbi:MAG TPA: hypothetical protein VN655_04235 [Pseudolabrys sp.]|nr:hypothetical protein [Pseudolabrys sp.]
MISIVVALGDDDLIEAGMVGHDGLNGGGAAFAATEQRYSSFSRLPGHRLYASTRTANAVRDGKPAARHCCRTTASYCARLCSRGAGGESQIAEPRRPHCAGPRGANQNANEPSQDGM